MKIDTEILRTVLKANKLIYKDSVNLKKFEESIDLIEQIWVILNKDKKE